MGEKRLTKWLLTLKLKFYFRLQHTTKRARNSYKLAQFWWSKLVQFSNMFNFLWPYRIIPPDLRKWLISAYKRKIQLFNFLIVVKCSCWPKLRDSIVYIYKSYTFKMHIWCHCNAAWSSCGLFFLLCQISMTIIPLKDLVDRCLSTFHLAMAQSIGP